MYEHDIFISYNRHDEDWAAKLAERLEQEDWSGRKLKVFFAPWDIRPGQSIPKEIESALPQSRKVGLILSPEAIDSAWVELERLVTTYIAISARDERLIPLYRRTCEIPALLQPILYIDFRDDASFEEQYRTLLAVIRDEPLPRRSRTTSSSGTVASHAALPRPPFVGFVARRDKQGRDLIERLKEDLAPQKNQLVTLSGPGGIGKTTLAAEAARALKRDFQGRVVWSDASARAGFTVATLLDDIATQLGQSDLRTLAPEPKAEQVRALVAVPPALVVLDNYETIANDERERIKAWLLGAPCPALITSRPRITQTRNISVLAMSREEAQELLERLVGQTQDRQMFSAEVRQRIYETAEANPFLMEWIVAQIDDAKEPRTVFEELARGDGDAAERVFARSFNLPQTGDDGRAALLALSLFVPSASREALAAVAGFGDEQRLNEAVKNLRALWLIKGLEENRRFTIEGLTRSLTGAQLNKHAQAAAFRQRFVAYFRSYAEAHAQPTGEDYDLLEAEKDNLLRAIDVAFALEDWAVVQAIARVLAPPVSGMLSVRGYWDEAIQTGEQAEAAARSADDEQSVAEFAGNTAGIRLNRGEYDEARKAYQQALIVCQKLNDELNVAVVLHQLAMLAQDQGELTEARRLYDESLEIERKLGDLSGIASTLHQLGRLAEEQGDKGEAARLFREASGIFEKLRSPDAEIARRSLARVEGESS